MDSKSLAKSKRAHSLHHKKHHPNQKGKGTTSTVVPPDKAPGKVVVVKEKARVGPAALPSNWDRYEYEDDPMGENQVDAQPSDVVVPKSKGADYAYLILRPSPKILQGCLRIFLMILFLVGAYSFFFIAFCI
ncbi:hypothetical protein HanLR1_Chr00c1707g0816031 [Helianthus annuus]|nr:hypothetical protein HanLR1_Chr00c1707g0816031 [Helianthus annuus]